MSVRYIKQIELLRVTHATVE